MSTVDLSDVRGSVELLKWAKAQQAKLKEVEANARAAIEEKMGEAEIGTLDGEDVISWSHFKKRQLDQKALREKHPELVEEYTNLVESRQFKVIDA